MEIRKDTLYKALWLGLLFIGVGTIFLKEVNVTQTTTILFGDEGYWATFGRWTADTLQLPRSSAPYTGGTPVFVPYYIDTYFMSLLLAGLFKVGGETLVKSSTAILSVLTALTTFLFVRRLHSLEAGVLSAIVVMAIPSFITYSVLIYVDVLVTLLMLWSLSMLFRGLKENSMRHIIVSGILGGMAALTKETGFLMILVYLAAVPLFGPREMRTLVRRYAIVFSVFALVVLPWNGIHNLSQFGSVGTIPIIGHSASLYTGSGTQADASSLTRNVQEGTEARLSTLGILNYASFAYTTGIFFLSLVGFAYILTERKKEYTMLAFYTFAILLITLYIGKGRTEDAARFALPAVVGLGAAAGIFVEEVYTRLKNYSGYGKFIAGIFVVSLVFMTVTAAEAKATALAPIKVFPQGFYDGCNWIKENTPQDARFMTLWASRAAYQCQRDFYWSSLPDFTDILIGNETLAYAKLKEHDINYIYVQKFSISFTPYVESYPIAFIKKLEDTVRYANVYENNDVVVFKVN